MQPQTVLATDENFNEVAYLCANLDVAAEVMEGRLLSGYHHFQSYGRGEGRHQIKCSKSDLALDARYLNPQVNSASEIGHANQWRAIEQLLHEGVRFLEVGSRRVTGAESIRPIVEAKGGFYCGFDYYGGDNVDVVGDAHRLSKYFDQPFDFIYSSAVFEHLAMPWVVAAEMAKLLTLGGHVFVESHFAFSTHERPWDFFRFTDNGLKALFNPAIGFECVEVAMSNPIVARFSSGASSYLSRGAIPGMYCHCEYLGKKVRSVNDVRWDELDVDEVVGRTVYPEAKP